VTDHRPVWLLDVDGVINATRPGWGATPRKQRVWSKSSKCEFTRIQRIHRDGLAEIRWCTTWCCDAEVLENQWHLPEMGRSFVEPINGYAASVAKLAAARQVLADGCRLVWTDDAEVSQPGNDLHDELTAGGQALLIAPRESRGLQPDDLDRIETFLMESRGMNDIEKYAVKLVAEGAESVAEDDLDEDGEFENEDDWRTASDLGVKMARTIADNPEALLGWYRSIVSEASA
jgi:hypothetical protein